MLTFLEETLNHVKLKHKDVSSIVFILPTKRACGFLEYYIKRNTTQTSFAPKIISIDSFLEDLSNIKVIDQTELLFKSYTVYKVSSPELEKDDFDVFTSWASTLLNDFSEIDRNLVPAKSFFNYLSSIHDINHWYVREEKTEIIKNYLKFWRSLYSFYTNLKEALFNEGLGYPGMVPREASENIEHYISGHKDQKHIFIGFNALNKAEETIIQEILETGFSEIYWNGDIQFYQDNQHSSSYYLRKYISTWDYYKNNSPLIISDNFNTEKKINIIEVQKNIGQAKYIGQLLSTLSQDELNETAIILSDKNLLQPLLFSLPDTITSLNLSMGVAIKSFPSVVFFELLLSLHIRPVNYYYFKHVLALLHHPLTSILIANNKDFVQCISEKNITHLSYSKLYEFYQGPDKEILQILFGDWKEDSSIAISMCIEILSKLKKKALEKKGVEMLINQLIYYKLFTLFDKIKALNKRFEYLKTIKTVQILFSELISLFTLDYKGDSYKGLQIMGILESCTLDFKNVIIASVNEGVLPPSKRNASYITFDLKQQYGLPTYSEKDIIYTHHFYSLLHRSKNCTLLYNNFSDGLNTGEKSRYISQLEIEVNPLHHIEKSILSPKLSINASALKSVQKTEEIMSRIETIANEGYSPSALTSYLRNPLNFYYQRILGINEFKELEETEAAKTLGTIVHDTLEIFYQPYEGCFLSVAVLGKMKLQIDAEIEKQFKKNYAGGNYSKGENLIIFEVAKRFVSNFINYEIDELNQGNRIKIIKIESELTINIPMPELPYQVKIKGKVDRVDEYNNGLRIIDYKTGVVNQSDLEVIDWEEITKDYKYHKIIQVLSYALMMRQEIAFEKVQAGIISFKSLGSGFLKFGTKTSVRSRNKNQDISEKTLDLFLVELKKLILEIGDPSIPFNEKEV